MKYYKSIWKSEEDSKVLFLGDLHTYWWWSCLHWTIKNDWNVSTLPARILLYSTDNKTHEGISRTLCNNTGQYISHTTQECGVRGNLLPELWSSASKRGVPFGRGPVRLCETCRVTTSRAKSPHHRSRRFFSFTKVTFTSSFVSSARRSLVSSYTRNTFWGHAFVFILRFFPVLLFHLNKFFLNHQKKNVF